MRWFRWLIGKTAKPATIAVGSTWVLQATDDPFPVRTDNGGVVKVLDVKDGWVRYDMGPIFPDERMRLEMFLYCYKQAEVL